MGSKGKGYRTLQKDGFEILVGKGAADNDRLTFEVAEPRDFWLHVHSYPGSHVVIRNPDELKSPPKEVALYAAELAAWHSKARGARGKVDVHLCQARDVHKPPRFPAGKVLLRRWDVLKVYVKEPSDPDAD